MPTNAPARAIDAHTTIDADIDGTIDQDAAWTAVCGRDRGQDGRFVFAVSTTGIYCRPSCPARRPARAHVRFFADGADALAAGFRACLRCRPDGAARETAAVAQALALIAAAPTPPRLGELAAATGYSPAHFQRVFTRAMGVSPATYGRALRMNRARAALTNTPSVTAAVYAAGYEAPSRFYAEARDGLGMAPSAWARGGAGVRIHWAVVDTSYGAMLVAATDVGVCRVAFGVGGEDLAARFPQAQLHPGDADFAERVRAVVAAVESPGESHAIPLDIRGTVFQQAVWRALQAIPAGETRSYAQLAAAIGKPGASRAAGSANGANPVAVLVPCHRVIRGDGTLGGYAWGLDVKRALLGREGVRTPLFHHTKE